jgi:hypothetical protein
MHGKTTIKIINKPLLIKYFIFATRELFAPVQVVRIRKCESIIDLQIIERLSA